MRSRRSAILTRNAVLTAVALILFTVEAQLPPLVPISGVKLGLANIITVYAVLVCGALDALLILLCRIVLSSIFAGQVVSFMYSLCGGLLCYAAMLLMRRLVSEKQLWICSVLGAVAHNIGQLSIAVLLTGSSAVLAYLPVLLVSGIISGAFIGLCAQLVIRSLKRSGHLRL